MPCWPQRAQNSQRRRSRSLGWSVPIRCPRHLLYRRSPPRTAVQLSTLPEALSYSLLALPASGPTLIRRDIFDARFQLLSHERDEQAAQVANLVLGVYEGVLKTWRCSFDLAAYVNREVPCVHGLHVLEVSVRE
jgi:hypothetical protein